MAELSIKNFPDDLMHELKVTALAHRLPLREYVIRELSELMAVAPSPAKGDQPGNPKKKR